MLLRLENTNIQLIQFLKQDTMNHINPMITYQILHPTPSLYPLHAYICRVTSLSYCFLREKTVTKSCCNVHIHPFYHSMANP